MSGCGLLVMSCAVSGDAAKVYAEPGKVYAHYKSGRYRLIQDLKVDESILSPVSVCYTVSDDK